MTTAVLDLETLFNIDKFIAVCCKMQMERGPPRFERPGRKHPAPVGVKVRARKFHTMKKVSHSTRKRVF